MVSYSHKILEESLTDYDNTVCFDCKKRRSSWASVNNAVYLCTTCAAEHRSFGVKVSFVRSLTLDNWKDDQAKLMKIGGNKRFRELVLSYNIDLSNVNIQKLYSSRLAEYYRNLLQAENLALNELLEPPTIEEALISSELKIQSKPKDNLISTSIPKQNSTNLKPETETHTFSEEPLQIKLDPRSTSNSAQAQLSSPSNVSYY